MTPTFLVVALLGCVLVPLPTPLVDLLLSISLAGSVLLLVASLGVRRSADFLSFPKLLLLVTLYRLAINVSTTRLILSQADAGRVVDAFASFVVRGDLVVGGVMFAILSVIQYLVIARGAERVAEVAARFALDGLPGHQQAIEADLRAGLISPGEAARRRSRLVERSSFHGAMDGAIRFVKGDAVAGLAITGINLVGGLAIGIGRMGYPWQDSLDLYGRLTIGDGLLAQIPALLVSVAAGVLVSRVDEDGPRREPDAQWLDPAMLLVPAVMLLVLALVPGMPGLAFATTAVALLSGALLLAARVARARPPQEEDPSRLQVRLHPSSIDDARALERALSELGARLRTALGMEVPPLRLVLDDALPPLRWELRLGSRRLARVELEGRAAIDVVLLAVFRAIMDHAPSLVDLQDLEDSLEQLRGTHPMVVRRALEVVDVADLLTIVRAFLRERLPRPPLRAILSVVAEDRRFRSPTERPRFVELVREQLASHWVTDVLDGISTLGRARWIRLTPDAEEALMDRTLRGEAGLALRMSAAERDRWLDALRSDEERDGPPSEPAPPPSMSTIARLGPSRSGPVVLLTTAGARPCAAALVAGIVPHVPVLSIVELERSGLEAPSDTGWLDLP
ncbi:FHIPEP family type III secretion protein [Paraliomyxa miuraensis]|uniref:FHIPEP family type III secretion protein n=1 Tax=Paraliomyxa miuraensis TaxID=376150 RepID=UPI002256AB05|nr:FHIPEP family type III secretion protein [Paraliomyxa miuraensis]MCX4243769.1 flagellar biosynthesis protein FlhA [Paraliomyxa miuraensis]